MLSFERNSARHVRQWQSAAGSACLFLSITTKAKTTTKTV